MNYTRCLEVDTRPVYHYDTLKCFKIFLSVLCSLFSSATSRASQRQIFAVPFLYNVVFRFSCLNKSKNASGRFHLISVHVFSKFRGNFAGHALQEVSRSPTAIICRKPQGSGSSGELFQLDIDKLTNSQRWFSPRREFFFRRIRNGYAARSRSLPIA